MRAAAVRMSPGADREGRLARPLARRKAGRRHALGDGRAGGEEDKQGDTVHSGLGRTLKANEHEQCIDMVRRRRSGRGRGAPGARARAAERLPPGRRSPWPSRTPRRAPDAYRRARQRSFDTAASGGGLRMTV